MFKHHKDFISQPIMRLAEDNILHNIVNTLYDCCLSSTDIILFVHRLVASVVGILQIVQAVVVDHRRYAALQAE